MIRRMISTIAADPREDPRGGWREQAGPSRAARTSDARSAPPGRAARRPLEVAGAAFGERQRSVGHAPQLHPFLRARGRDRALEVAAGGVRVEALGGARAEDRQGGGLVFGLGLELLVGALLERLDRLHRAALLHPDLSLFGGHRRAFYGCAAAGRGAARRRRVLGRRPAGMLAAWRTVAPLRAAAAALLARAAARLRRAARARGALAAERRRRQLVQRTLAEGPGRRTHDLDRRDDEHRSDRNHTTRTKRS